MVLALPMVRAQEFDALFPQTAEPSDVGFLTRLLQDSLSDRGRDVRITGFRGALSSRATFDEMTIADADGVWLRVQGAALQWNRAALLDRRIEISEITAARVHILRAPVAEETTAAPVVPRFELPDLPVGITIGALSLQEVQLDPDLIGQPLRLRVTGNANLTAGEGAATLRIDRTDDIDGQFQLEGSFSNTTRLLSLDLLAQEQAGGLAVTLLGVPDAPKAALRITGAGPIDDFDAAITLDTDDIQRVSGTFALQTGLAGVSHALRLDLSGDLRPLMVSTYQPFFGTDSRLRLQARRFDDGRLALDDLRIQTNKLRLDGRARLGADRLPELIDLRMQVADPDGGRVLLPVAGGDTSLERAELRLSFDAAMSEDWELILDAIGFANSNLTIETAFVNGLGRITSQGFGEDIDVIDALLEFSALGIEARDPAIQRALGRTVNGSLAFIWREGHPLLLPGLFLEGRDYVINGRARLEEGVVQGDGRAEFDNIARLSGLAQRDLGGALALEWSGSWGPERDDLSLRAEMTGQDLRLSVAPLDRLLAGQSSVSLDLTSDNGDVSVNYLRAQAQTLTADVRGKLAAGVVQASGALDFSDISVLGEGLSGALRSQVTVDGPLGNEAVTLTGEGRDLAFGGPPELSRLLRGTTTLSITGVRDDLRFDLRALDARNPALSLTASGQLEAGASDLRADLRLANLALARPGLGGALDLSLTLRENGETRHLSLDGTGQGLRAGNPALDRLLAGRMTLAATVQMQPDALLVERARLSNPNLNAEITGRLVDNRPDLRLSASLRDLALVAPGISGQVTVNGTARDSGAAYALDLSVTGPASLAARIDGDLAKSGRANLRIIGNTDIALVNPRIEPRSVQGMARFDLALDGPLAPTSLRGSAQVSDAQLVIPDRNIRAAGIQASAQISGGQAQVDVAAPLSTGGNARLQGQITLAPPLNSDLTITLDRVRLIERQLLETRLTGNMRVTGALALGPSVSGTLRLEDTEIRVPRVGLVARNPVSMDIVHRNEPAQVRATRERAGIFQGQSHGRIRRPVPMNLTLEAPNRIFVRGRGLDAELGGSLLLTGTNLDLIPIGEFSLIRGRLDVLGNRFTLNEGFVNLQGDLVPFVRLVASTDRNGVTARIVLEGRADQPEIRFESIPPLPEEEVVALLLFGRGVGSLSVFQAAQLASSLATLSGRSEGIMEKLRRNLGVDDLDLRTDEQGATSVSVGRYLTDNIYTNVEVKPQGASEVSINIDLSPSLTVRGRVDSDGRSGIGLFFERDY
jgi:translocation and assembly module TamB